MCGRYVSLSDGQFEEIQAIIHEVSERYKTENIAKGEVFPTNLANVIYEEEGKHILAPMRWQYGDISGKPIINARSETIIDKPFFRSSFYQRRCLVPAQAYIEWKQEAGLKKKTKYEISLSQSPLFFMAGIYHTFKNREGTSYTGFSIITTTANQMAAKIHERMPVILSSGMEKLWLQQDSDQINNVRELLRPYEEQELRITLPSTH